MLNASTLDRFTLWLSVAEKHELNNANAMMLATVDRNGLPNIRPVLMKQIDEQRIVFYTNLDSTKGRELLASKKAAICFTWRSIRRSVRMRGYIELVSNNSADAYFATRPRVSQLGAWASKQSEVLESRRELMVAVAKFAFKFGFKKVPRPKNWSGFSFVPEKVSFEKL